MKGLLQSWRTFLVSSFRTYLFKDSSPGLSSSPTQHVGVLSDLGVGGIWIFGFQGLFSIRFRV